MGFAKSIRQSGGFLNNVDGTFTGYEFTSVPPQQRKKSEWVYLVPSIQVDGAEKEITQHLFLGAVERYTISEDGLSLTMVDESPVTIGAKTPTGRFLATLLTPTEGGDGFPEDRLPDLEAGEALTLEAVNGTRLRFVQEKDPEGTEKAGKRKDKKTGKEYDRTNTLVAAVLALPGEEKSTGKSTKPTKAVTTTTKGTKAAGKPNGKVQEEDLTEEADEFMLEILALTDRNGNIKFPKGIERGGLRLEATKLGLSKGMKSDAREALQKFIYSDEYLVKAASRNVITFNQKTQIVAAA